MRIAPAILLTICFCVSGLFAGTEAEQSDLLEGQWSQLPLPPSRHSGVSAIGIEPSGTLWVMAKNSVYYWDGKEFHTPIKGYWDEEQFRPLAGKLTSGQYLTSFFGGSDRGLYATQTGEHEHTGEVYELVDGRAIYVTDFYYDVRGAHPGFYVSKSGQLFNWGKRFLAVYVQDQWKRIQTRLSPRGILILDTSEKVYFYYGPILYSVDRQGNFDKRQITSPIENLPEQKIVHGVLWGRDKKFILAYFSKKVYAYHLDTGEPVDTEHINLYLDNRVAYDVFSSADGAVWLLINDPELRSYVFLRITPEGDITTVNETTKLGWNNTQCRQFPHSVLNASDGSIWFATRRKGISRYKNGKMQVFDWHQGVSLNQCRYLLEGSQGQIYASSNNGVYVFRPGLPVQQSAWIHQWQEYRLASSHPIRDCEGNICMFLEDHPDRISRWDGYRWHHMDVPFDTSGLGNVMADNRGHLLWEARAYPAEGCYDISASGTKHYSDTKSMLVAAIAVGANRFYTDRSYQGCFVLEGGKIWFGYHNRYYVSYFDGERWDDFTMRDDIFYLYESPKYGILFRTQGVKYYTYDGGQIKNVEISKHGPTRWLMGPKSLQPYEQELLDAHPKEYIPLERAEDGKLYTLIRHEGDNTGTSLDSGYQRADPLYLNIKTVTPGIWGGHWSDYSGGEIGRFFDGRVLKCDFQNTPLLGNVREIRQVLEDRAHNLWIDAGWYSGARHVFMKRLSDFKLTTEHVPTEAKRSVTINTEAQLSGQPQSNTRLFWRFKEDPWHGGEYTNSVTIYFQTDGFYQIEMVAMGPIGGITPTTSFGIHATVPLPDTILTETGPYTCKDIIWQISASAVPSEPGQLPHLVYRIDGKEWQQAYKGNMISFQGLEPGQYHIQIAAVEDERYYDATPLALNVTFAPDYNLIVEQRLELIMGDDPNQVQAALAEIKMAGSDVVPVLRQKLAEARKVLQLIAAFEHLIREIQRGPQDIENRRRFESRPPPPPPPRR